MGAENTNINVTLEAWAGFVIQTFLEKMDRLGIGYSDQLADSLEQHVIGEANGDSHLVEFAFKYYGKFVDMGVGSGVSLGETAGLKTERRLVGRDTGNRRHAKPWYNKTMYSQIQRLTEILAEKYARQGVLAIVENVEDNALKYTPTNI